MVHEAETLLYLALLLGLFSGAFFTWAILLGLPIIFNPRRSVYSKPQTEHVHEYKPVNEVDSPIIQLKEDQPVYAVKEDTQSVEKERQRIAYELHDDTVQRMSAVRIRMEQFSYRLNKPEQLEEVNILRKEMNQIIKSIRLLIWGITSPEFRDNSLTSLLRELVKKLEKILHLDVTFECSSEELEFFMTPENKQAVYRMVQEVTQNFVNHSMGFALSIQVNWIERLMIIIHDNGQGFSKPDSKQVLASIQKRATDIGAVLTVTSPIGRGLDVTIELKNPLQ